MKQIHLMQNIKLIKMKINTIFESLQGEGRYAGCPATFIRLSGCTRNCKFCDTDYHDAYEDIGYEEIINKIREYNNNIVVWTGGEPLMQRDGIADIKKLVDKEFSFHLETNGDLISVKDFSDKTPWSWITISPKDIKVIDKLKKIRKKYSNWLVNTFSCIKVTTDLKTNKELIKYADTLMPLTVDYNGPIDKEIKQQVWQFCVKHNKRYSPRLHIDVWGTKRGI